MGVASYTVTIECKVGWPMLTVDTGSSGTRLVAMYWSDWATLWEELEAAQWRSLHPACPRLRDLGRVLPELELEVTDGQETKKVACPVVSDIQHQRVMKAFEQVLARSR